MREDGVGAGGAAFKGKHGIRYEQTHSDSWLEDVKQEVCTSKYDATIFEGGCALKCREQRTWLECEYRVSWTSEWFDTPPSCHTFRGDGGTVLLGYPSLRN